MTGSTAAPAAVLRNVPLRKKHRQRMCVNVSCVTALSGYGFRQKYISFINPYFSLLNNYKCHCLQNRNTGKSCGTLR